MVSKAMGKVVAVEAAAFEGPGAIRTLTLPPGHRFVVLVRGAAPSAAPVEDPGDYEIQFNSENHVYPVLLLTVEVRHLGLWLALDEAMVEQMVDGASERIAEARADIARHAPAGATKH